jgi:hypothetical protein
MKTDRKLLTNIGLIVLAVALVIGVQMSRNVSTVQASADKDCVCHAAGKDKLDTPQQYICIHPSVQGVTLNDNGGHLNEDSSHGPVHAPTSLRRLQRMRTPTPSQAEPSPSPA